MTKTNDAVQSFNWGLFIKRTWAGPFVGAIWAAEEITQKHDSLWAIIALSIGFLICPILGYLWTRISPQ